MAALYSLFLIKQISGGENELARIEVSAAISPRTRGSYTRPSPSPSLSLVRAPLYIESLNLSSKVLPHFLPHVILPSVPALPSFFSRSSFFILSRSLLYISVCF